MWSQPKRPRRRSGWTRESFASNDDAQGADQERTLGDGGISRDPVTARLVYQETTKGTLRLAWELGINQLDDQHWWQIRMDAATGDRLGKTDWVAEDSHRVYPFPTEAPSFGARALVSNPATSASPFGWNDTNGAAGAESTLTVGNNAGPTPTSTPTTFLTQAALPTAEQGWPSTFPWT